MFWLDLAHFFREDPEFSDMHHKAHPVSDHVAKFYGNRPKELGDIVAKYKKNICCKT